MVWPFTKNSCGGKNVTSQKMTFADEQEGGEENENNNTRDGEVDEVASYAAEDYEIARKNKKATCVQIIFGTAPSKPLAEDGKVPYQYYPAYRHTNPQMVILGINGNESQFANRISGFIKQLPTNPTFISKIHEAAKQYAMQLFDKLFTTGNVGLLSLDYRGHMTINDDGVTIEEYEYFATLNHLEPQGDLWYMQEGPRSEAGMWRKWQSQPLAPEARELAQGIMFLEFYQQPIIPYSRMPADDRLWYPGFLEGNCFQRGSFTFNGEILTSSNLSVEFKKAGCKNILKGQVLTGREDTVNEQEKARLAKLVGSPM